MRVILSPRVTILLLGWMLTLFIVKIGGVLFEIGRYWNLVWFVWIFHLFSYSFIFVISLSAYSFSLCGDFPGVIMTWDTSSANRTLIPVFDCGASLV